MYVGVGEVFGEGIGEDEGIGDIELCLFEGGSEGWLEEEWTLLCDFVV